MTRRILHLLMALVLLAGLGIAGQQDMEAAMLQMQQEG